MKREIAIRILILFLIISSFTLIVIVDPMSYVFRRSEGIEIPYSTNVVPENFPERELISNESLSLISQIVLGSSTQENPLYEHIVYELRVAIQERVGFLPDIVDDSQPSLLNNSILIGSTSVNQKTADAELASGIDLDSTGGPQSFMVRGLSINSSSFLIISGGDMLGDAYGVFWLIEQILYSSEVSGNIFAINELRVPSTKLRITDADSTFMDPLIKPRKSSVEQIDSDDPPFYLNETRLEDANPRFEQFLNYTLRNGYNALQFGEFHHLITYDNAIDGIISPDYTIYSEDSKFRARHLKYQDYYSMAFERAENLGISTYVYTKVPMFTLPLEAYVGDFANIEGILTVYSKAIDEFFTRFPKVDGLMLMTGEIGGTHDLGDYYGKVVFNTQESLKALLRTFIESLERHNKTLIYRTWSIGIGDLGDIHIDPEQYDILFSEFEDTRNLIVSIKYTAGDFQRYLPFNPNFGRGTLPQMVEVQSNLEYGGMGLYPNHMSEIFQEFMANQESPPFGMWTWSQSGATPRESANASYSGPWIQYLFKGFWSNADANFHSFGKIAWTPDVDVNQVAYTWVLKQFGNNPIFAENFTRMLMMSDDVDMKGLYIEDYAKHVPRLTGDMPSPQQWIWWAAPQGSSFALAPLYQACKDGRGLAPNVADGHEAAAIAREMKSLVSGLVPDKNQELYLMWARAVDYSLSLFSMLASYRECFLYYYSWSESRDFTASTLYIDAFNDFLDARDNYLTEFQNDPSTMFPIMDLSELNRFIERVQNTQLTMMISSVLFTTILVVLVICLSLYLLGDTHPYLKRNYLEYPRWFGNKILHPNFEDENLSTHTQGTLSIVVTLLVIILTGVTIGLANFLVFVNTLVSITFIGLVGFWFFTSGVLYVLVRTSFHNIKLGVIVRCNAFGLFTPLVIFNSVILGIITIYGPQKIWLFWSNSVVFSFIIISLIVVVLAVVYIQTKMLRCTLNTSNWNSLLIVSTTWLTFITSLFILLATLGFDLWNDVMYGLHNTFSLFLSTMFQFGPGVGAWVPITILDIAIYFSVVTLAFIIILLIVNRIYLK